MGSLFSAFAPKATTEQNLHRPEFQNPPQHIPVYVPPKEQFFVQCLKFNGNVTVEVKWPALKKIDSLIIILSNDWKTKISAYCIITSDFPVLIPENLNSLDAFCIITIYGLNHKNKVLLSSVLNRVVFGKNAVTLNEHNPRSSFTKIFPRIEQNMKKSVIKQNRNGHVVFNPPTQLSYQKLLISVKTSSQTGSTLNYSEYMFYRSDIFQINLILPSREFVKYTIYQTNTQACFVHTFITHNTQQDVADLLRMANALSDSNSRGRMIPVHEMYRNKPYNHDTIVESRLTGILATYLKDNNGDQASSINNQIKGLFFSASPDYRTLKPQTYSYFGNYRIKIQPRHLISGMNMYFADFYCNNKSHYVTLVVTKPGSNEDNYCRGRLVELDDTRNTFLMYSSLSDEYFTRTDNIWVEVLYTQNIHKDLMISQKTLKEEMMHDVRGRGQSTTNGFPKNLSCNRCNLPKQPYVNQTLV